MVARAKPAPLPGRTLPVVDPHDLIVLKLRAARVKDDYDVSQVLARAAIDAATVQQRTTPAPFEHFLAIQHRTRAS